MFPDLIDLGFLHIKTYGAMMATGFIACWWLIEHLSGRKDLSNLLFSLLAAGIIGSRLAYVIEHWQVEFAANPFNIVRVDQGGLMFYGGLVLAAIVFFAWCRVKRESPLALADILGCALPLGHAFGRLGCFFYGCCYGRDSDCWCAVRFPVGSPSYFAHGARVVGVLPTQLFEAGALIVLFVALLALRRRLAVRRGALFALYCIGYAIIRFGIEILRGDPRANVGMLSIGQTVSVGLLVLGGIVLGRAYHNR